MSTIGSGITRVGQPDDTAGQYTAAVAVPQALYVTAESEIVLFLADADRSSGHWIPVLNGELVSRYLVDEGHSGRIRPQVAQVTGVTLRCIDVTVSLVVRVEVRADRATAIA